MVIERKVLRRICTPNNRGWRELRNDKFHNLYSSANIIRVGKGKASWDKLGHVASMGGVPRYRSEDNIKM